MMHNSSMLENQSGLHQGRKMYITIEGFPPISPFLQGPATEQEKITVLYNPATHHSEFTCCGGTLETACT